MPSAAELARIEREQQETAAVFARRTPLAFELPLGAPLGKTSGQRLSAWS